MTVTGKNPLYFIAIVPNEELQQEVTVLKKHMAEHYHAKASLSSPPHITLFPPFRRDEADESTMDNALAEFAKTQHAFEIELSGFGCFKPRVIFIKPIENAQLQSIQSQLLTYLKDTIQLYDPRNDGAYHPHMTIATRDLQKKYFYQAWDELKEKHLYKKFPVQKYTLLRHNGKTWDIYKEYSFSG